MALRDKFAMCPRGCDRALEPAAAILAGVRLICAACTGTLVPERGLQELIAGMKLPDFVNAGIVELPLEPAQPTAADPSIRCPLCESTMERHLLRGTSIDRCPEHGIWLDADELSSVVS